MENGFAAPLRVGGRPWDWRSANWGHAFLALAAGGGYALAFRMAETFALLAPFAPAVMVGALALLFMIPRRMPPKQAMGWGFVAVFVGRMLTLGWLTGVSYAGWLVLSAVCAVFVLPAIRYASVHAPPTSSHGPFRWAVQTALLYTAWEALLGFAFGGFPWNRVATAVAAWRTGAQLAELAGAPLLTGLAALAGAALAVLAVSSGQPWRRRAPVAALLLVIPLAAGGGRVLLARAEDRLAQPRIRDTVQVALVQTSIPQPDKWSSAKVEMIYGRLDKLTRGALSVPGFAPDLIIWPEAALPDETLYSERSFALVTNLVSLAPAVAGARPASLLTGSLDLIHHASKDDYDYANAALLFGPYGKILGNYAKRKLVIVGEYLPVLCWLPTRVQEKLAIRFGTPLSIAPGRATGRFQLPGRDWFLSPLICFEDVFAGLSRADVGEGSRLLVNLTNDAWFDEVSCPRQHALNASLRAIETRTPLLRCANTGLTCHIDPTGRFVAILGLQPDPAAPPQLFASPDDSSMDDHFLPFTARPGILFAEVRIHDDPPSTLFLEGGCWLDPALALFALLQIVLLALRRYRQRRALRRPAA